MSASRDGKAGKGGRKPKVEVEAKPEKRLTKREVQKYKGELWKFLAKAKQAANGGLIPEVSMTADPNDQATTEADCYFDLRTRDRARKLVGKINEVLQLIEDGEYGVCEDCGEQIPRKRLDSRPQATKCLGCRIAWEKRKKRLKGQSSYQQLEV